MEATRFRHICVTLHKLDPIQTWCPCMVLGDLKMNVVQTCLCPEGSMFTNNNNKGLDYGEIGVQPVQTTKCLCPGMVPKFVLRHRQKAMFRLGAHACAQEKTPSLNGALVTQQHPFR